jgi:ribosomal protein L31
MEKRKKAKKNIHILKYAPLTSATMGNAVSASSTAIAENDDDVNDDGEENSHPTVNGPKGIQRRTSSSKFPLAVPRRLSQRPGCTITLKNIGCKITCKSTKKKKKKRREERVPVR